MPRTFCLVLCLAATAGLAATARAAEPQIAETPPMGWNDWYAFFCNIDERLVTQTADAMVSSGMRDAGYRYVNLDDCWMSTSRDADSNLQADPQKFPHGIEWLADYVHARGLNSGSTRTSARGRAPASPAATATSSRTPARSHDGRSTS